MCLDNNNFLNQEVNIVKQENDYGCLDSDVPKVELISVIQAIKLIDNTLVRSLIASGISPELHKVRNRNIRTTIPKLHDKRTNNVYIYRKSLSVLKDIVFNDKEFICDEFSTTLDKFKSNIIDGNINIICISHAYDTMRGLLVAGSRYPKLSKCRYHSKLYFEELKFQLNKIEKELKEKQKLCISLRTLEDMLNIKAMRIRAYNLRKFIRRHCGRF